MLDAADALSAESGEAVALLDGPKNGVLLEPDDLKFMMEQAGIGSGYDEDEACALVLWVGETIDQDGEQETRTYGLNFYNDECPEEGSICIKELPRPTNPTPAAAAPTAASNEGEEA